MKLGIVVDIHEDVAGLRLALAVLGREAVDRVVLLGDLFETGGPLPLAVETIMMASDAGVTRDDGGIRLGSGGLARLLRTLDTTDEEEGKTRRNARASRGIRHHFCSTFNKFARLRRTCHD